jgi:hypothetical protein
MGRLDHEPPIRILLAEDDPVNQYVFRMILTTSGYVVDMAENGLLALEHAERNRPRLILLDMMMPVMDGYETAQRMSANPALDGVPILALTAKALKGDLEKTLDAGCDDYISKPVSRAMLLSRIRAWLCKPTDVWMARRLSRRQDRAA